MRYWTAVRPTAHPSASPLLEASRFQRQNAVLARNPLRCSSCYARTPLLRRAPKRAAGEQQATPQAAPRGCFAQRTFDATRVSREGVGWGEQNTGGRRARGSGNLAARAHRVTTVCYSVTVVECEPEPPCRPPQDLNHFKLTIKVYGTNFKNTLGRFKFKPPPFPSPRGSFFPLSTPGKS